MAIRGLDNIQGCLVAISPLVTDGILNLFQCDDGLHYRGRSISRTSISISGRPLPFRGRKTPYVIHLSGDLLNTSEGLRT